MRGSEYQASLDKQNESGSKDIHKKHTPKVGIFVSLVFSSTKIKNLTVDLEPSVSHRLKKRQE